MDQQFQNNSQQPGQTGNYQPNVQPNYQQNVQPNYQSNVQPGVQPAWTQRPVYQGVQKPEDLLPPQYKPLGAWAYFGYSLLFSIPVVGFIFLIIFSVNNDNINRRNFARSFWCALAIVVIVGILAAVSVLALGGVRYFY